jgi:hypothetical protein
MSASADSIHNLAYSGDEEKLKVEVIKNNRCVQCRVTCLLTS